MLHRIAFPVVSEWYQYRSHGLSPRLLALAMAPKPFADQGDQHAHGYTSYLLTGLALALLDGR
jgi:hypothetical protein